MKVHHPPFPLRFGELTIEPFRHKGHLQVRLQLDQRKGLPGLNREAAIRLDPHHHRLSFMPSTVRIGYSETVGQLARTKKPDRKTILEGLTRMLLHKDVAFPQVKRRLMVGDIATLGRDAEEVYRKLGGHIMALLQNPQTRIWKQKRKGNWVIHIEPSTTKKPGLLSRLWNRVLRLFGRGRIEL